ncbi:MAG: hypothetical protein IKL59_00175 [Clostridia bacterium]|nr:hypothetical protein [Clostridia bacterium]
MLKKTLALVLALIMLMATMVGCSTKETDLDGDSKSTKNTTAATSAYADEKDPDPETESESESKSELDAAVSKDTIDLTANPDVVVDDTSPYEELTIEQLLTPELFQGSDIPDDRDYGGYEFKVLADTVCSGHEFIAESDGTLIKDAVINRQEWIEEYVAIDFALTEMYGGYNNMDGFAAEIESASGAGSPYDLVLAYSLIPPVIAAKGLSRDLAESENLNLYNTTKEYWGREIKKEIMVGGRIFWMSDNSSWLNMRTMLCIFVNTEFFTRINPTMDKFDLYEMVDNGVWNFENMLLLAQNSYENTNIGDEKTDGVDDGDTFGLQCATHYVDLDNWLYAAGLRYTRLNNKGTYEWTLDDQTMIDFIDWWHKQIIEDDDLYKTDPNRMMFMEGRAMFAQSELSMIEKGIEIDFTVLPMPLYDPNIKNGYSTPFSNSYSSWLIPKATKADSFERSATVLELLAAEGNRRLAPVYFEIYLKRQVAFNDEDMRRMFNIIRNSIVFDMGYLYGSVLTYEKPGDGGYEEIFIALRRVWGSNGTGAYGNMSTLWAGMKDGVTKKLNNLMVDILDY